MPVTVAIQMDPIEQIDIRKDSTFALALAAQKRGYELYHYQVHDLVLEDGQLLAKMRPLEVRAKIGNHASLGEAIWRKLDDMDVVLMRQDPPFDMNYITATHLLEHISDRTLVINDPVSVRNAPEKLFVTAFVDLMPPTLIARNLDMIRDFRSRHQDIIIKPLFGNGGAGVFHLTPEDENLSSLVEIFEQISPEPLIIQKYIPAIKEGDKRIILVDGEPVGGVSRLPPAGEVRANFHVGGRAQKTVLTARDYEICGRIGPVLREKGLVFAGIDVIGDYLTEINVTSPTGIHEINALDNIQIEELIWDAIIRRHSALQAA